MERSAPARPASSAWAPLRIGLFRTLWLAALVSNIGTWMQTVGAQWLVVHSAHAIVVAAHPKLGGAPQSSERFLPGLRAGGRYVRNAPVVRRILLRAALFLLPGSCLWALLPLIATTRLALGVGGYGLLLAALGAGAIGGAFFLPQARAKLSANAMVAAASLIYAAALAVTVLSRYLAFTIPVLLLAGAAWIAFLANVNAALQLFLPRWVRARGLAVYQMVLFGGQAAGALIWGAVAGPPGWCPRS